MYLELAKRQIKKIKIIQNIFKEVDNKIDLLNDLYKKYLGVEPNGFLGNIPLFVISTDYSQDNEITGYKSFLKENFNENIFINPYTLKIEVLVYGKRFIKELKTLLEESKKRKYTFFSYEKTRETYIPLAITSISYREGAEDYTKINVSINLKEVNLLEFITDDNGVTTTNVFNPNETIQNKVPLLLLPNDSLITRLKNDVRTSDLI